jgi:hypothetical protein
VFDICNIRWAIMYLKGRVWLSSSSVNC